MVVSRHTAQPATSRPSMSVATVGINICSVQSAVEVENKGLVNGDLASCLNKDVELVLYHIFESELRK